MPFLQQCFMPSIFQEIKGTGFKIRIKGIKGTVYLNPKVRPNNYNIKIIGGLIFYEVHI